MATELPPIQFQDGPETEGLWSRFVRWTQRHTGYPKKVDFCNCGADVGHIIPRAELIQREGVERDSVEYRYQLYGAALYWHIATTPGERIRNANPDLLRDKDVLEVACMRGGGARYLAEVAGPRKYVATDHLAKNVELCRSLHSPIAGLEFDHVDACNLPEHFPAASFDFVLCVQGITHFDSAWRFADGVAHVLRPGGQLLLCDAFEREKLQDTLAAFEEARLTVGAVVDISTSVHAVGLCRIPAGLSYVRIVVRRPAH